VDSIDWTTPTIRVAAAGVGAALAGPLGAALGGLLGDAVGSSAAGLIKGYAEKFGETAAEKLLDSGADSLIEKLKTPLPDMLALYREALRLSLQAIRPQIDPEYEDWFSNWNCVLASPEPLDLASVYVVHSEVPGPLYLFRLTLERLDAQGVAIGKKDLSLTLRTRQMPEALVLELGVRLPEPLQQKFRELIVTPKYEFAWKEAQFVFQHSTGLLLGRVDETTQKIERQLKELKGFLQRSSGSGEADYAERWVVKIDRDGHLAQSDEEIALVLDEMLVGVPTPNRFIIAVDKRAMWTAIGTEVVEEVRDFGKLYNSITSSWELVALASKQDDPASSLSAGERILRVDAKKLARLWEPVEAGLNKGILCFRDGIGRYNWLGTSEEAAEATRAFVDLYFDRYFSWREKPLLTKIDVWRDIKPQMDANVYITVAEVAELEATIGGPLYPYLVIKNSGFTANEFSGEVIRQKLAPHIVYRAIMDGIPIHEQATADLLFVLGSWNIGLG
jgi:hypothetical protein